MAVANLVFTIISSVAAVLTVLLSVRFVRERNRPSWRIVEQTMKESLAEIRRSGFDPDVIVGVGRGGAIVAGMLAGNLGHRPLFVIDTVLEKNDGVSEARIRYPDVMPSLAGKRILVAVGELYSGEDLKVAVKAVREQSPASVKTFSLFSHPATGIKPDFCGHETKQPLSAPWRMSEEYRVRRL
ncbi:phosphoribosyltransferase [Catenuloplanes indicus]|uniref:Hypoxanthine phosphoribosyltransferase n=1 Tax=Catenuloplanes indicus TaxID=137267 RepID=A0AAE3W315_9ACTN|nr:phosphoribosyltransferase family protein [Catenuloplanes indicus]MDQ0368002.1 hypoxanthine phosphoribosyltransferase [Catenuloplanes indicus]